MYKAFHEIGQALAPADFFPGDGKIFQGGKTSYLTKKYLKRCDFPQKR